MVPIIERATLPPYGFISGSAPVTGVSKPMTDSTTNGCGQMLWEPGSYDVDHAQPFGGESQGDQLKVGILM